MSKNRFYMYTEYIHFLEGMTIEDQALLFRVILQHEGGLKVEEMTPAVKAVFSMIKNRLDNNREEYEKTCEARAESGRKGGLAKSGKSKQMVANGSKSKQTVANSSKPKQSVADNDNENEKDNDKENDIPPLNPPTGEKVTATAMIDERGFPEPLESAVKEWVQYKAEKRQGYKPTGLKSLLTEVAKNAAKYGNSVVIDVIRKSIAANYTGIVWDWCRARQPTPIKKWASDEPPDYDPYAGVDKDALADFIRATEGDEVDQDVLDAFYHAKKGG